MPDVENPVVRCADLLSVEWVPDICLYLVTKSYPDSNLVCWFFIPPSEGKKWMSYL